MTLKKNYMVMIAVAIALVFIISAFSYKKAHALGTLPFGGEVEDVNYCCNGLEISVGAPDGGDYTLTWTTLLTGFYADYNVFVPDGQYVLGNEEIGGECVDIGSYCEDSDPTEGTMTMIGSSGF